MRHMLALLLGPILLLQTAPSSPGQGEPPEERRPASGPVQGPVRLQQPRWPKLTGAQQELVETNLKRLGHKDPEVAQAAAETLKALGPGVAPYVLGRISDAQPQLNELLESIAAAVVAREHSPVLAPYLQHHLKAPRGVAAKILARTQAREACPALEAALEKERDPELRERMALSLCALGDPAGLPALFDLSLFSFLERRAELLEAAAGVKGPEATVWLLERLEKGPAPEKLACLRLLALAGTREAVRPIAAYLDHENHTLKTEAINALRSIVDGRPPFKHISVFDMIRLRQEWQGRLPGLLKEK